MKDVEVIMILCCEKCRYLFSAEEVITQCPDCGKVAVRPASEAENAEYARIQLVNQQDRWEPAASIPTKG